MPSVAQGPAHALHLFKGDGGERGESGREKRERGGERRESGRERGMLERRKRLERVARERGGTQVINFLGVSLHTS